MRSFFVTSLALVTATTALLSVGCSDSNGSEFDPDFDVDGGGGGANGEGGNGFGFGEGGRNNNNGGCGPNLTGILRDFHDTHPDFEKFEGKVADKGIVSAALGADFKPVYAPASKTATTSGKANFDQWYRDVPGINVSSRYTLALTPGANGISTFNSNAFFPLDGAGFGNETRNHNFHFTFELHTEFLYKGGEVFSFTGDDDLFVFINGKLAIDIGGVHGQLSDSIALDDRAAALGIEKGKTYGLSVFSAERHTVESNFRIDTSIGFTNCEPIIR